MREAPSTGVAQSMRAGSLRAREDQARQVGLRGDGGDALGAFGRNTGCEFLDRKRFALQKDEGSHGHGLGT